MFSLCQNSQLLRLNFIGEMCGPGLQEQFCRFGVKNLLLWHCIAGIDCRGCFFGQKRSVEGVLGQECLAKFGVAQSVVSILVKSTHKEGHFILSDLQTQITQTLHQIFNACATSTLLVEQSESIDQVEISFQRKLDLGLFYLLFKFQLAM